MIGAVTLSGSMVAYFKLRGSEVDARRRRDPSPGAPGCAQRRALVLACVVLRRRDFVIWRDAVAAAYTSLTGLMALVVAASSRHSADVSRSVAPTCR